MRTGKTWSKRFSLAKWLLFVQIFTFISKVFRFTFLLLVGLFILSWSIVALYGRFFEKEEYDFSFEVLKPMSPESTRYTSGDRETDIIVNYFAGYKDIPREWKVLQFYNDTLENLKEGIHGTQYRIDSFKNLYYGIKNLSPKEFDKLLLSKGVDIADRFIFVPDQIEKKIEKGQIGKNGNVLKIDSVWSEEINRESLYHIVWQLYFASNSPKLRYGESGGGLLFSWVDPDAMYDPLHKKLILLDLYTDKCSRGICRTKYEWNTDLFLEELGHAKQFMEKPCSSLSGATKGLMLSLWRSIRSHFKIIHRDPRSWSRAYNREYYISDSFEYEAHTILGDKYKNLFQEITDSYEDIGY